MNLDRLLNAIRSLHQRVDTTDKRIRALDQELHYGHHPLETAFLLVDKDVKEAGQQLQTMAECPTCERKVSPQTGTSTKSDSIKSNGEGGGVVGALSQSSVSGGVKLATREETTGELRRRLAKEIYRFEIDLGNRLKIGGRGCDCGEKHSLGVEALVEELEPREPEKGVYGELTEWLRRSQAKLSAGASVSGEYDREYPKMAGELAAFRKRIMGTEAG